MPDGRTLGVAFPSRERRIPWGVVLLVAALGVAAWPTARHLARRLEALREHVARWGPDNLDARVPVDGHDEVSAVALAFNAAAERVSSLVQSQRRTLASASHELRSPLTRIRMAVELMDSGANAGLTAQAIADIEELDATIGDLLLIGRLQAVGLDHEGPVDLHALLVPICATAHGPPTIVQGDARLLRIAARNLVDNARRYAGEPEVWTTATGFVVADRGPGVAPQDRERIFEAFWRPQHHAEGRDGGVGLGLWLVREILTAHKATIDVLEREGGGARFEVRWASLAASPKLG
jgi:signal transduction histidine kinase